MVDEHGELRGLMTIKDIEKSPDAPQRGEGRQGPAALRGGGGGGRRTARSGSTALLKAGCDVLVVDTAHGHSRGVLDAVQDTRRNFSGLRAGRGQRRHRRGDPGAHRGRAWTR